MLQDTVFMDPVEAKHEAHHRRFIAEEFDALINTYDADLYYAAKCYLTRYKNVKRKERQKATMARIIGVRYAVSSAMQWLFFVMTQVVVLVSCLSVALETTPEHSPMVHPEKDNQWRTVEIVCTVYFTLELLIRLYLSANRRLFFLDLMNWVDIVSVSPFYISFIVDASVSVLRFVRLLRVIKFMRVFDMFSMVLVAMGEAMKVLIGPAVLLVVMVVFMSALMYYTERGQWDDDLSTFLTQDCACESTVAYALLNSTALKEAMCPLKPSEFRSIPLTTWWAVATLTTVGYGDFVPKCAAGKLLAGFCLVAGSFFMAMPIAIVGSYFTLSIEKQVDEQNMERLKDATQLNERPLMTMGPDGAFVPVMTPADRLIQYLSNRALSRTLNLRDVSAEHRDLLSDYLTVGCVECCQPARTRPERWVLKRTAETEHVCPTAPQEVELATDRLTLTMGSSCSWLPDPDLPLGDTVEGVCQRHVAFTFERQRADRAPSLHLLPLVDPNQIEINGDIIAKEGRRVIPGDEIDFCAGANGGQTMRYRVECRTHDVGRYVRPTHPPLTAWLEGLEHGDDDAELGSMSTS
eukprot:PhM_4_TR14949/c0_g1_i1/m.72366/K04886/KCNB2; potassium voltage-gated channel Shab-related subfamily B member 2